MDVRAVARNVRASPEKVRLLADMVRGKKVEDALTLLKFSTTPLARPVAKAIQSAAANAESAFQMTATDLTVAQIYIDRGMMMKRYRAAARGRAAPRLRRTSHITVVVSEQESHGTQS